eukprot:TRINITY_DN19199_c0_g2_i1.p1 TRINITY_DN19199_c0_g2~~TRINITY_DN19199_c0_g2_i1.p1  ORF type:complete len:272 (+),score=53.10 TRINITY_DN19199_c0_g2_i1:782-1597(+)
MCIKYKLTHKAFRNMLITYDFKGHFLPSRNNDDPFPIKIPKPSFFVTCDEKPKTGTSSMQQNQQSSYGQEPEDEPIEDSAPKLHIKPTYGVKYRSGDKTIKGMQYNKNPIYGDRKVSLRTYYRTCGNKKVEELTSDTPEETVEAPSNDNSKSRIEIFTPSEAEEFACSLATCKSAAEKYYKPKTIVSPNSKLFFEKPSDTTVIHTYDRSSSVDYFNEQGVRRETSITPQRFRSNKAIFLTLRKLRDNNLKKKCKLPPPPLGYTVGHGILNR